MSNPPIKEKRQHNIFRAAAIGWAYFIFILYSVPDVVLSYMNKTAARCIISFVKVMFGNAPGDNILSLINTVTAKGLTMTGFAALSALLWATLYKSGYKYIKAASLSFIVSFAAALVLGLYHGLLISRSMPAALDFALYGAGSLVSLFPIVAFLYLTSRFPRVLSREFVSYIFYGAITTLINILVYGFCYNTLEIHNLISNVIAWVSAVLFAYMVNKLFVFRSVTRTFSGTLREFALFIGARLFSLGVDELGMWLLVDILIVNGGISKIFMNIIVLLINYFFSKAVIFNKNFERPD